MKRRVLDLENQIKLFLTHFCGDDRKPCDAPHRKIIFYFPKHSKKNNSSSRLINSSLIIPQTISQRRKYSTLSIKRSFLSLSPHTQVPPTAFFQTIRWGWEFLNALFSLLMVMSTTTPQEKCAICHGVMPF